MVEFVVYTLISLIDSGPYVTSFCPFSLRCRKKKNQNMKKNKMKKRRRKRKNRKSTRLLEAVDFRAVFPLSLPLPK